MKYRKKPTVIDAVRWDSTEEARKEIQRLDDNRRVTWHISALATGSKYDLMKDGEWHTRQEICSAARAVEGLRRMRELRRWFEVEKYRPDNSRVFIYRLRNK